LANDKPWPGSAIISEDGEGSGGGSAFAFARIWWRFAGGEAASADLLQTPAFGDT
jgi:hypothetical protein